MALAGAFILEAGFLLRVNWGNLARQTDALEADSRINSEYEEVGELLLHRLPPLWDQTVSVRMPILSLTEALLLNHEPRGRRLGWMCAAWLVQLGLLALLCSFLGPWPCPLIAVAIFAGLGYGMFNNGVSVQFFYSLPVSLVAAAIAWREQHQDTLRSWVVGFCVGFSLLCRSTLAFLPLVLGAAAILRRGKATRRQLGIQLIGLCVLPYLFLVPWIGMNWSLHGQFIPFEYQVADAIIIPGALGVVEGGLGHTIQIPAEGPDTNKSGSVLAWAIGEILRHPGRYARACWQRLCFIFKWHPLLFSLAAAACLLRYKGRASPLMLSLFCLYFIGVHCLMAVLHHYFMPLLPILVAMVSLLVPGKPLLQTREKGSARFGAAIIFGSFLLLMGGLALYANHKLTAYAKQNWLASEIESHLESELRRNPGDAWLTFYRGRLHLNNGGDVSGDFSHAAEKAVRTGNLSRTALMYQELHRYGDSLNILDNLIVKAPLNGALWEQRGVCLALAGKEQEAIHDLRRSIGLAPTLSASFSLGTLYANRKAWREARAVYEAALRSRLSKHALLIPVIQSSLNELPQSISPATLSGLK